LWIPLKKKGIGVKEGMTLWITLLKRIISDSNIDAEVLKTVIFMTGYGMNHFHSFTPHYYGSLL
jgi:hypothetical protein